MICMVDEVFIKFVFCISRWFSYWNLGALFCPLAPSAPMFGLEFGIEKIERTQEK